MKTLKTYSFRPMNLFEIINNYFKQIIQVVHNPILDLEIGLFYNNKSIQH